MSHSNNYGEKDRIIFRAYWRELGLRLHLYLHQDGFAAGDIVVALLALDCGRGRGDGLVCLIVATGHCKNAALYRLYVQGHQLDFCAANLSVAVW